MIVYIHRSKKSGVPFYVGMGGGMRRARSISGRSKEWRKIAAKGYSIEIYAEGLSLQEARSIEEELIKKLKHLVNGGTLINRAHADVKFSRKAKDNRGGKRANAGRDRLPDDQRLTTLSVGVREAAIKKIGKDRAKEIAKNAVEQEAMWADKELGRSLPK